MIWDSPEKPSVEDAIAEVRARTTAAGTVIPQGIKPRIVRHDPGEGTKYGSLHLLFEWEEAEGE